MIELERTQTLSLSRLSFGFILVSSHRLVTMVLWHSIWWWSLVIITWFLQWIHLLLLLGLSSNKSKLNLWIAKLRLILKLQYRFALLDMISYSILHIYKTAWYKTITKTLCENGWLVCNITCTVAYINTQICTLYLLLAYFLHISSYIWLAYLSSWTCTTYLKTWPFSVWLYS